MGRKRGQDAPGAATPESKVCAYCGRDFDDRKRWRSRSQWEDVKYCSRGCSSDAARARRRERNA
ncbi:DUF2256 domain-containing protein [Microbacteriaceae bacterium VKM Ac-2854]|nr:DUF2256 domain-containing protein [Microbacteriaceae bacterium VKM Ac-2854]